MARKTKLFIPLLNKKGRPQLVNAHKVISLKDIIPSDKTLHEHLLAYTINNKKYGTPYRPFIVKVDEEKWNKLEKELKSKVPGCNFRKKAFDIITDSTSEFSLVQIFYPKPKENVENNSKISKNN